jgi:hypothetical protein
VEWPLVKLVNGITTTERKADAKGTLHHYRRTVILNEIFNNKGAVLWS